MKIFLLSIVSIITVVSATGNAEAVTSAPGRLRKTVTFQETTSTAVPTSGSFDYVRHMTIEDEQRMLPHYGHDPIVGGLGELFTLLGLVGYSGFALTIDAYIVSFLYNYFFGN